MYTNYVTTDKNGTRTMIITLICTVKFDFLMYMRDNVSTRTNGRTTDWSIEDNTETSCIKYIKYVS